MPIRMVDDPDDQLDNSGEDSDGGHPRTSGGGGGLLQLLPLLLGLFIRKPLLLLVVLGAGAFFYFRGSNFSSGQAADFGLGGVLDPRQFDKAPVYEGLDPSKNDLPEAVSLLRYAPDRKNQGQQGSCVAWSSAYGARTILEAATTGVNPNQAAFSPAFLYNQIGLGGCQGSYLIRAMENLTQVGAVPYNDFPYDETDCSKQPPGALKQEASRFRMLGFTRLTDGDRLNTLDLHALKEHLAKDVPVVIGMMVGGSFMQEMEGQEVWHPTQDDYSQMGFGGHALCVIGYDDRKEGGAFQLMNSWGPGWGQNGVAWIRYNDFKRFVREAYGLNPMPLKGAAASEELECSIGLVEDKTRQYIPLRLQRANVFETGVPVRKGTRFKMEVKNTTACYVYVLGRETDGSSYVLFPYPLKEIPGKTKFSPYCGITGYRLFPRGMSMMADSMGTKDYLAVVVSKQPLDVFRLNEAVNAGRRENFAAAVNTALKRQAVGQVSFRATADGTITFTTAATDKNAVACVVEVEKQE